jgi:hypothetical protein
MPDGRLPAIQVPRGMKGRECEQYDEVVVFEDSASCFRVSALILLNPVTTSSITEVPEFLPSKRFS